MKKLCLGLALIAGAFTGLAAGSASAAPFQGPAAMPRGDIVAVQYHRGPHHMGPRHMAPHRRVCRVDVVRRRTHRGVVVERVRRCFPR